MDWFEHISLFGIVLLGGIFALKSLSKDVNKHFLKAMLTFSGAYLLGIVFLHIFPLVYLIGNQTIGITILMGFAIQVALDRFSGGIEHGHVNHHSSRSGVLAILIALCVHALMEGLPISHIEDVEHAHHKHTHTHSYLYGILMHKLPAAFTLATFLFLHYGKTIQVWIFLTIFAMMTPIGGIVGDFIQFDDRWQAIILGLVSGSLIHISTTILYETDSNGNHNLPWSRILLMILGISVAYLSEVL